NLRSELDNFMSGLAQFKEALDKAEIIRKEVALVEITERREDLNIVIHGTRDLLKAFGTARGEMAADLKARLDAFIPDLAQFKADLDQAETERKDTMGQEISDRREHVANLKADTLNLINDFEAARKEMWLSLKSELETFTSALAQFKTDLDQAETERKDTVGQELKEKAEELRANLSNFGADLSASVAGLMGELKKDRSEAAAAWNEILSTMRSQRGAMVITTPAAVEAEVEIKTVPEAVEEEVLEEEQEEEQEEELEEREENIREILELLEDNPDGLRMVEIADILGFDNWRSLIPIIRELLDDGEITKVDSTYYAV
ncbi:MAG: hypothetical protein MUP26_00155, partial [Desulfobulbaceae bacterium]|nr:hypothetical protein [Desulfobulbaceae bacterium]